MMIHNEREPWTTAAIGDQHCELRSGEEHLGDTRHTSVNPKGAANPDLLASAQTCVGG